MNTTTLVAIQASVSWSQRGVATATNMLMRILGQALGGLVRSYANDPPPATFRLIVSPMVTWIWIGALIVFGGALIALALAVTLDAQTASRALTTPSAHFGHEIGADYVLPDYTQFMAYWQTLARESERMVLDTLVDAGVARSRAERTTSSSVVT